jgi:membrane protein YqaA with SNARE-associated domain
MTDATSPAAAANATPAAESPKAKGPLRGLYNWVLKLAGSKHAEPWLFGISFAESSFFPIPPDAMLAPMCFARPERAYRYALVCTIASVLGALLGYAIGYWLFETVGSAIISFFGYGGREEELRAQYADAGAWIIFLKGVTPIPFKLVTIVSGAMAFRPTVHSWRLSSKSVSACSPCCSWWFWSAGSSSPRCCTSRYLGWFRRANSIEISAIHEPDICDPWRKVTPRAG